MVEYVLEDFVIIRDFTEHCDALLEMVQNPREGEIVEMPDRCYNFFTKHVVDGGNPESIDDMTILRYSEEIKTALLNVFNFNGVMNNNLPAVVYPEGCGMGLHDDMYHNSDDPDQREKVHVYSSVHYLNDDYQGGELVFPDLDLTINPEKNMLLLFGCHHKHRGNPSTGGIKISSTKFWRDEDAVQSQ